MKKATLLLTVLIVLILAPGAFAQECHPGTADVDAGPIWDQADANKKCPTTCSNNNGTWNGQWKTTVPGKMSVCGCQMCCKDVDAGPIWNQADAEKKCPATCADAKGVWNGQWKTTEPGEMSVCGCCGNCCKRTTKDVDAGPIWDQADAKKKCPTTCAKADGTWNGQWRTTKPGEMSVCGCVVCG